MPRLREVRQNRPRVVGVGRHAGLRLCGHVACIIAVLLLVGLVFLFGVVALLSLFLDLLLWRRLLRLERGVLRLDTPLLVNADADAGKSRAGHKMNKCCLTTTTGDAMPRSRSSSCAAASSSLLAPPRSARASISATSAVVLRCRDSSPTSTLPCARDQSNRHRHPCSCGVNRWWVVARTPPVRPRPRPGGPAAQAPPVRTLRPRPARLALLARPFCQLPARTSAPASRPCPPADAAHARRRPTRAPVTGSGQGRRRVHAGREQRQ